MSDLISRADAIKAVKHSTAYMHDDLYEAISIIPSAETTGALDDAIAKYVADGLMLPPSADRPNTYADVVNKADNKVYSKISDGEPFGYHSADRPTKTVKLTYDIEKELDEESYEIGYTHGQMADRPSGEWIPCSERLPSEKDGRVLVTKRDEVMIAIYSEFSGRWYLGDMCAVGGENPIAWMPLPMPYREDGEV